MGGLYCVLWGKNKEAEAQEEGDEEKEQKTQSNKEIQVVECITHQWFWWEKLCQWYLRLYIFCGKKEKKKKKSLSYPKLIMCDYN